MNLEQQTALRAVEAVVNVDRPAPELLTEVCRILQGLRSYTGVYLYVLESDALVLAAFHGRPTEHTRIASGEGICGASVRARAPVVVADVETDPRYLACNLETRSEIVFPVLRGERYLAQIDVDSDDRAAFGADDEAFLALVARHIEPLF
jgi:L-methionine (R)-S-oxide reductase